ncbi:hypothetical protein LDENG_00175770 [Lucifuga dentata]|nr:hypothetical protein LDENG_00175770 [Lucifuga dentata]
MEEELPMECEEEGQGWFPSSGRDKEEDDEALEDAVHCMEEEEEDPEPPPVRVIPIPPQPATHCSPPPQEHTPKASGPPQGFVLNGRSVPLLPGGGGAELKLRSHPGGSAGGFTNLQIPVTLTVHSAAGNRHINTLASVKATITVASTVAPPPPCEAQPSQAEAPPSPPDAPHSPSDAPSIPYEALPSCSEAPPPPPPPVNSEPEALLTPVITDVISGEAAEKVLSEHKVNFFTQSSQLMSSPPLTPPTVQAPPTTIAFPKRPAAPSKLYKGQLEPVSPPACPFCKSQYRVITALRGFMCRCSPVIAECLRNLKRKSDYRWQNEYARSTRDSQTSNKTSSRTSKETSSRTYKETSSRTSSRTSTLRSGCSEKDFLPDQPISTTLGPQSNQSEPVLSPPQGKLVILVEDFYYGTDPGQSSAHLNDLRPIKTNLQPHCKYCPRTLSNNIELMAHTQQHVRSEKDRQEGRLSCPHCFRRFSSSFMLQLHLEAVHGRREPTATCRICEVAFNSDATFLLHMKYTHKPGEMPYVCQVCDFRSSFYSVLWSHFQETHVDTNNYMCQYCLKVMNSSTYYQYHVSRHQRKTVFNCDKCRLHFLYRIERREHAHLCHGTHIKPPQLSGLKPGTKVTVRTYSVVGGVKKSLLPLKVVDVPLAPPPQVTPKKKRVESLGTLLSNLSQESSLDVSHLCLECGSVVQDFRDHFPTMVRCSLCRFLTCCPRAFADHMINNHATANPGYQTMYLSSPRLLQTLKCVSCMFSTRAGDTMANHLTERPDHRCCIFQHKEPAADISENLSTHTSNSVTSCGDRSGAFIPIHLLPSGTASTQLSVKPLTSSSTLSSPPAMTIRFLGPPAEKVRTLMM